MMGTINCSYETPCGWCTKFDKECDRKINKNEYSNDGLLRLIKLGKGLPTEIRKIEKLSEDEPINGIGWRR